MTDLLIRLSIWAAVGAAGWWGWGFTVARRFNAGDYAGACDAFLMWDKFQGRALRGLTLRRERERAMCLGETP